MALVKKSDTARTYNITQDELKALESAGIITPISLKGEIYYSKTDDIAVKVVLTGRKFGFSLDEIKLLIRRGREQ